MNTTKPAFQKKCSPCEGMGHSLSKQEARERIKGLSGWKLSDDAKSISREFTMKNFVAAIELIRKVAETAEAENHHPDIHLTKYRNLRIELSTHAVGGLSENDFILAEKIDRLPAELKK